MKIVKTHQVTPKNMKKELILKDKIWMSLCSGINLTTNCTYRTYSRVSRPAYKPTPQLLIKKMSKMVDPRISQPS